MPISTKVSGEFGRLVGEAMGSLSLNQARTKTGISDVYLMRMKQGVVPSENIIHKFCRGFGVDTTPFMIAAGYQEPSDPVEAIKRLLDERDDLTQQEREEVVAIVRREVDTLRRARAGTTN